MLKRKADGQIVYFPSKRRKRCATAPLIEIWDQGNEYAAFRLTHLQTKHLSKHWQASVGVCFVEHNSLFIHPTIIRASDLHQVRSIVIVRDRAFNRCEFERKRFFTKPDESGESELARNLHLTRDRVYRSHVYRTRVESGVLKCIAPAALTQVAFIGLRKHFDDSRAPILFKVNQADLFATLHQYNASMQHAIREMFFRCELVAATVRDYAFLV